MTGFNWESCDHTCGGRKAVGLGRMLSCSVLEARPELSPQGGLGAGGWAQWSQKGGVIQEVPHSTPSTQWIFCGL